MDTAFIYNPEFGDEDSIDEQLVFTYGEEDKNTLLKLLGVSQGVVELAYTFDGHPVSWLNTGTNLVLVRQVEPKRGSDNWRNGFWISCSLGSDTTTPAPESLARLLTSAYRQWYLHNGSIEQAYSSPEGRISICE